MTRTEDLRLESFSAGEHFAVDPDSIERELAALWRSAGQSTNGRQPVTRACLWNVVVHVEERDDREGAGSAEAMVEMVNAMPRYLAARALVLKTQTGDASLDAWISANCILSGDGGKLVCSEEITLLSKGTADRRLPSLVRALLVPAMPTAVVFDGVPDRDDPMVAALVRLADRIIVNVDRSRWDAPLERASGLVDAVPAAAMDLGWLAGRHLRQEVAALFDPPRTEASVRSIDRIVVRAPKSKRWTARLLLGWFVSVLDVEVSGGDGAWTDGRVKLVHEERDSEDLEVSISVPWDGCAVTVCAEHTGRVEVTDDVHVVHRPHEDTERAAFLARALTSRGQDDAFRRALAAAGRLT